jgi:hypothetical protein
MEPLEPSPEAAENSLAAAEVEAAVAVARRVEGNIRRAVCGEPIGTVVGPLTEGPCGKLHHTGDGDEGEPR